ncbi:MAG TPA: nickel pincer cofactor biosynthesis protein LarC [Polyangiaceae bacterium]|nr:nickel pincer cofactor biosynthesis protein LarC [Polyangiaceae bacterium]
MGHRGHDRDDAGSHGHGGPGRRTDDRESRPQADPRHADGGDPDAAREPAAGGELHAGAGRGKILFLDAPSGLAGDIVIAALTDLGVPRGAVMEAVARLPVTGFHVHFGTRVRSGIVATSFEVHVDEPQPSRTFASIRAMLDDAPLEDGVRARAQRTFHRLALAEARVHACAVDDVHFHEVGAVDAIVDVVGSAAALHHLGAELVVSPLPMGRGFVRTAHGTLPLPAPATVECLAGLDTYDAGIEFELVTPTGAAIVGAHASRSHPWPALMPERTGWGAGTAELSDRPNVLRAVLGRPSAGASRDVTHVTHTHSVLEANVDDATGELAASWIDALFVAGALDVWATPIVMKKGRPGLTISALASVEHADAVAHAMLRETTSLGVRRYGTSRIERPRRMAQVETPYGRLPVKISEGPFGPPQIKPEFDACVRAAHAHGVPVREVLRAVALAAAAAEPRGPLRGA